MCACMCVYVCVCTSMCVCYWLTDQNVVLARSKVQRTLVQIGWVVINVKGVNLHFSKPRV